MNMIPLQRRMKTERTAITTLKLVVLDKLSKQTSGLGAKACSQLPPWQRRLDGAVVRDSVYELIWIAVPPMIGSFLPKPGAV